MEIKRTNILTLQLVRICLIYCLLQVFVGHLYAQHVVQRFMVRDGKMMIEIGTDIQPATLDSFVNKYRLQNLGLGNYIYKNNADSLQKQGWQVEKGSKQTFLFTMAFASSDKLTNTADKIVFTGKTTGSYASEFPAISGNVKYGINKFKNKNTFEVIDSVVTFYLRNNTNAKKVMLAGSFNNWQPDILPMVKKDSGWIAYVKLTPGKYWYKFIVDGSWTTDNDNLQNENDNRGNINSVYYQPNTFFKLDGYNKARKVFVAGSFNDWKSGQLRFFKTPTGWVLPMYLADGTHTYRFVVDDNWFVDPANKNQLPNEFNEFNSVINKGNPYTFKLNGYTNAKQVVLTGSFNGWRNNELIMRKTASGWELPYIIAAGNYEYRFIIDGKEMADQDYPTNIKGLDGKKNGFLVIQPNYTFRLKGNANTKTVAVSGEFTNWNPNGLVMKKVGDEWICSVHLSLGKHLYKFIVNGEWIKDPNNKLWEQNEFNTGNSIVWMEQ